MTSSADWTQRKGSGAGVQASSAALGPAWVSVGFLPATDLEATVRILYSVGDRLARYQVEVSAPTTRELLALRSRPFHKALTYQEAQEEACKWLSEAVAALLDPDPF